MAQVIRGVLKEELANSRRMQQRYERALCKLGKGSLVLKRIAGHPYYYLAAREDGRVGFRDLGKLSEKDRQVRLDPHRQPGQYPRPPPGVKQQIRFLERSLHG